MTTDFRNAYHFVPRDAEDAKHRRKLPDEQRDFGLRAGHEVEGHAVYAPGAHSGRIACRITLECPTIIGGLRTPGVDQTAPAYVAPFLFKGRPAIPASSVKGMLSAVAEAAARAPYRVLTDMNLTVAFIKMDNGQRFSVRHQNIRGDKKVNRPHLTATTQIGTTHDYVDGPLRPLGIAKGALTRSHVNPVESMFGFVVEAEKGQKKPGRGKVTAAAGKLRVSHALPSGDWAEKDTAAFFLTGDINVAAAGVPKGVSLTLLKEQGAPMKQPKRQDSHIKAAGPQPKDYDELNSATPNFYFVERANPADFIGKEVFATTDPSKYRIQGGKQYLHNPDSLTKTPWKSAGPKTGEGVDRKAAAAILQRGVSFDFHVDFDNLTDHELNILCFALRPSARFRHKIGLGKALGLGSIRIDVTDLVLIDRTARYTAEKLFADDPRTGGEEGKAERVAKAAKHAADHSDWLEKNDKGAQRALLQIGETHVFGDDVPEDARTPVLWVPLTEERYGAYTEAHVKAEEKSFQWFTLADKAKEQKLRPIGGDGIPTLTTISEAPPPQNPQAAPQGRGGPQAGPRPGGGGRRDQTAPRAASNLSRRGVIVSVRRNPDGTCLGRVRDDATGTIHVTKERFSAQKGITEASVNRRVAFEIHDPREGDNRPPPVRALDFLD